MTHRRLPVETEYDHYELWNPYQPRSGGEGVTMLLAIAIAALAMALFAIWRLLLAI